MAGLDQKWIYPDRDELKDGPAQIKRCSESEWEDVDICGNGRMFQPIALRSSVFWDMTNLMFVYSVRVIAEPEQADDNRPERDIRPAAVVEHCQQKSDEMMRQLGMSSAWYPFLQGQRAATD